MATLDRRGVLLLGDVPSDVPVDAHQLRVSRTQRPHTSRIKPRLDVCEHLGIACIRQAGIQCLGQIRVGSTLHDRRGYRATGGLHCDDDSVVPDDD